MVEKMTKKMMEISMEMSATSMTTTTVPTNPIPTTWSMARTSTMEKTTMTILMRIQVEIKTIQKRHHAQVLPFQLHTKLITTMLNQHDRSGFGEVGEADLIE